MNDKWGVGDQANAEAFDTIAEGDLIHGQFPHSRNDNNTYLRRPSGEIVPFNGFRRLIDIEIKSNNYLKESEFSGDEVRKEVVGKVFVDGVQLIEEFGREPIRMMRHLETLIEKYSEHESRWFDAEARSKLVGRKIWYHDQPATIVQVIEDQGCVIIATELGFEIPRWDQDDDEAGEYDYWNDWKVDDHYEIKEEVLSPHIYWYRN